MGINSISSNVMYTNMTANNIAGEKFRVCSNDNVTGEKMRSSADDNVTGEKMRVSSFDPTCSSIDIYV